jgi:hypothetical protein
MGRVVQGIFAALAQDGAQGVSLGDEVENVTNRRLIVDLAEKRWLSAIYRM